MNWAWLSVIGVGLDIIGAAIIAVDLFLPSQARPLTFDMTEMRESPSERLKKGGWELWG